MNTATQIVTIRVADLGPGMVIELEDGPAEVLGRPVFEMVSGTWGFPVAPDNSAHERYIEVSAFKSFTLGA